MPRTTVSTEPTSVVPIFTPSVSGSSERPGGLLFRAHEWATREQTLRSYELFARYVMPRFQGSIEMTRGSNEWARENRRTIFSPNVEAIRRAFTDAGREVPAEFQQRTSGARDE